MLKKKINIIVVFIFTLILAINNVFAVEIYDSKITENVYKLSEDDSSFSIPFFRMSEQRMELDKTIDQVGLFMTSSSIDVNSELKGIQMLYTNDTVRINSNMEYAVIFSAGNVILNSSVDKTVLVYCNGTFTISEEAVVKGNVIVYAPSMVIDGTIDGNVLGSINSVTINNTVNGKLKMNVVDMTFGENAKIAQQLEINTPNTNLKIDENIATAQIDIIENEKESFSDYLVRILQIAITNFLMFLILLIFMKKDKIKQVMNKLRDEKIIKVGFKGYLSLIMLLCFGVVLLALLLELGIATIVFSAALMIIFTMLKDVIFGIFIADLVDRKYKDLEIKPNNILVAIVTFIFLAILENIPYVGWIISLLVFIIALGIAITLVKKYFKDDNNTEQEIIKVK
ncbi:MAG: polymer-forming cytoskeletal protein [Clostridia bacterium]|nr:polymer-forming cytoskeletal protein [Clostridia bacterium]